MNKLYIVRHGETNWNKEGKIQGITDIPLNENGISQAKKISKSIDISKMDVCFSSPLLRAKETAKIITNDEVPIIYDDLIKERYFGTIEGTHPSIEKLKHHWVIKENNSDDGMEPILDCIKRGKDFLNKINRNYKNKNILIVSHGAFIKCLVAAIKNADENYDFFTFQPENCIIYEYEVGDK